MIRSTLTTAPILFALLAFVAGASSAQASGDPWQECAAARLAAAGKYAACQTKAMAKFEKTTDFGGLRVASSKCQQKYASLWPKLQKKFIGSGTPCDQSRFVDTGTTVLDNLTGLEWEKKTDNNSIHDKDNAYAWTHNGDMDPTNADGSAYTTFLWDLNGWCFDAQCDWRLPTRAELQTIVAEPFPCATSPCIAATFGPTSSTFHITASPVLSDFTGTGIWAVSFDDGGQSQVAKSGNLATRAVRGGL